MGVTGPTAVTESDIDIIRDKADRGQPESERFCAVSNLTSESPGL